MALPDYVPAHTARDLRSFVALALGRGYSLSVNNGEEWVCKRATDADTILSSLAQTDNDTIRIRDCHGEPVGSVWAVYGNGPRETFADYSDNPATEDLVHGAYCGSHRF
jgi:hypothetical protein